MNLTVGSRSTALSTKRSQSSFVEPGKEEVEGRGEGSSAEAGGGDWRGIFFSSEREREKSERLLFFSSFFFFTFSMASSTLSLLRPIAGTTAAAVASTSYRAVPALPRCHSRRAFIANATSGDGKSGENDGRANRNAEQAIVAAAAAAAAAPLLAAQPAAASEHPIEGGWRHSLRPRRHLRAMGDFERDRLLRVRIKTRYDDKNITTWLRLSLLCQLSLSLSSQTRLRAPPPNEKQKTTGRAPRRAEHEGL